MRLWRWRRRQCLGLLRRPLTDEDIPLLTRVAATLVQLCTQPLTRILRLTIKDVLVTDGEISILIRDPPAPRIDHVRQSGTIDLGIPTIDAT